MATITRLRINVHRMGYTSVFSAKVTAELHAGKFKDQIDKLQEYFERKYMYYAVAVFIELTISRPEDMLELWNSGEKAEMLLTVYRTLWMFELPECYSLRIDQLICNRKIV